MRLDIKALPTIQYISIDKVKKRSHDIPTIQDRAKQALCLLALEPEWEAKFEKNSYGLRPGRYCPDAMEAILLAFQSHSGKNQYHKYILNAQITKCFDQLDQEYLIEKLNTIPEIASQVKNWLNDGILEDFFTNNKQINRIENIIGIPQGGIFSSLLINITLHGLENHMKKWICTKTQFDKTNRDDTNAKRRSLSVIRYVNEFVLMHKNKTIIHEAKKEISYWLLNGPRFKLNEEKTSIRNSNTGFNFLGFTFITIRRGNKTRTKIYPSRKSQTLLILKVRNILQRNRSISAYNLISIVRPIILGWANYFKYSECNKCFHKLTHLILQQLRAWTFRRDTRNGRKEVKQRYFPSGKTYYFSNIKHKDNWILNGKTKDKKNIIKENWLPRMTWVKSEKWVKIKGYKSPFDGDKLYWYKRTVIRE